MTRLLIMATLLASLGACSIMDISMLDTAVPLQDKNLELTLYENLGVDLGTMMQNNAQDQNLGGWLITGFKTGLSVSPGFDLTGRIYTSGFMVGGKLGAKLLVGNTDFNYLALAPSLTALSSNGTAEGHSKYSSLGAELAFLSSWEVKSWLVPTLGARVSYDNLVRKSSSNPAGETQNLVHGNVSGSLRLNLGPVILHPELGMEVVPFAGGGLGFFPTGSLGLGLVF
ncbi:MAG: hypothetical protein LHW45_00425 [Candidatus Cloacimonetes bacterium]|nr:hypothetical protein [Candidatus Cloacimonadota bacterium]MDY0366084.1 hypothetical protein [Candidatus Syntrophosphaera sp.]